MLLKQDCEPRGLVFSQMLRQVSIRKTRRAFLKCREEEDTVLMERIKSGVSIGELARIHGRTKGAIKYRVMRNSLVWHKNGLPLEQLSQLLHMSVEDLQIFKERQMRKMEGKKRKVSVFNEENTPNRNEHDDDYDLGLSDDALIACATTYDTSPISCSSYNNVVPGTPTNVEVDKYMPLLIEIRDLLKDVARKL